MKFICPEPITLLIRPIIFFVLSPLLSPIPTGIKYVRRLDILFETVTISLKRYIPGRVHSRIIWEGKGKLYFKINFFLKFKEIREINSVPLYQLFYNPDLIFSILWDIENSMHIIHSGNLFIYTLLYNSKQIKN